MRHEIIARALREGSTDDDDAGAVAVATVRAVGLLLGELQPLVGTMGAHALYSRSLHLARMSFRRPDPGGPAAPKALDELAPLHDDLASRNPTEAKRAGQALLHSFADLLVSLIGQPLTDRMLRSAWGAPGADSPLEEKPQ